MKLHNSSDFTKIKCMSISPSLRVGISTIYTWRPHVEYMAEVAEILRTHGHFVSQLNCEGNLKDCYNIAVAPKVPRGLNCALCRTKNLKSYISENHNSIGDYLYNEDINPPIDSRKWGHSSASTIGRFESASDYDSQEFKALRDKMSDVAIMAFKSAVRWIREQKLDRIIVFNGRIDATRGIIEAAKFCNIPFFTAERTPFGYGLLILPNESCLGLTTIRKLMKRYKGIPIGKDECEKIVSIIVQRFSKKLTTEWRVYNQSAIFQKWPQDVPGPRILILPSSTNEINNEPDWGCEWEEGVAAFDAILNHFNINGKFVVLRCHPNWGEPINGVEGGRIEEYYKRWSKDRGLNIFLANDKASTLSLIEQADVIIVNGGSSALEAGALGKCVISTRPSNNYDSSFVISIHNRADLNKYSASIEGLIETCRQRNREIVRATMRYLNTIVFRLPMFVNSVISPDPTVVKFNLCRQDLEEFLGFIQTADKTISINSNCSSLEFEDKYISLLLSQNFLGIQNQTKINPSFQSRSPRGVYKPLIWLRGLFNRGDRIKFGMRK
jgi:hypothetical protein